MTVVKGAAEETSGAGGRAAESPVRLILASSSPRRRALLEEAGLHFTVIEPAEAAEETGIGGETAAVFSPEEEVRRKAEAKARAVGAVLARQLSRAAADGGGCGSGSRGSRGGDGGDGGRNDKRADSTEDAAGRRLSLIVAADTIAALDDERLGKPLNRTDALRILSRLSGTRHRVLTGFCLWAAEEQPAEGRVAFPHPPETTVETTWVTMRAVPRAELEAYVASGEADGKAGAYAVQETGDRFVERLEGSFANVVGFPVETFLRRLPEYWRRCGLPGTEERLRVAGR